MNEQKYFRQKLLLWHQRHNKRELPWKGEKDVYRIWLSEIILQQTRAEQGMKYYERFITHYPTIHHLAKASIDEVYKHWEGLGYYNRCRNLHSTAQKIVQELSGNFPNTFEHILALKGIGPYTAAAISSFAYNLPYAVVDGNVFRVLSRFFGVDIATDSAKGKKYFQQLAQDCLDVTKPAMYNQAVMDFGASVCKPDAPNCSNCIMKKKCVAFTKEIVTQLPVKEKQTKQRRRWFVFYIMNKGSEFAVQKRTDKDVWANLYQFPNEEYKSESEWLTGAKQIPGWLKKNKLTSTDDWIVTKSFKQQLSHQTIFANAVLIKVKKERRQNKSDYEWKSAEQILHLPFPKILNDLLKEKQTELFMRE